MMNSLHLLRNQRPEMSMIKQTVQYALFLVAFLWLLYHLHHSLYVSKDVDCDFIDNRLTDERIGQVLGRKGGVGKSHYTEEMELYGVDLIGEAVMMNNFTHVDNDDEDADVKEGGADILMSDGVNRKSLVKLNAVILKKGEKMKILKVTDGNGNLILEHESGPSRRSDVEVKSVRKGVIAKTENQSKGKKVGSENATEKHRRKKMVTVKAAKGSMRDLLLLEM